MIFRFCSGSLTPASFPKNFGVHRRKVQTQLLPIKSRYLFRLVLPQKAVIHKYAG